jgi:hypothetical protein
MADFKFQQHVAPVQDIDTDTSGGHGGDGGESNSLAFGYNKSEAGDGGYARGGDGGDSRAYSEGGDANQSGLLNLNLLGGPSGGDSIAASRAGHGGNADADGGNATTLGYTSSQSSADGGDGGEGGNAYVYADQDTNVRNDFDFNRSFNEDNDTFYAKNSFNQDNDGVDNAGGRIDDSVVAGDDINRSFNSDDDVEINNSYNTDNREYNIDNSDDDFHYTEIKDSYNRDNDFLDLDVTRDIDILNG